MNRLQEHLVENQQLNNTLQLELSVYDKMHDDNKAKSKLNSCMKFQQLYLSLKESGDLKMNAEFTKKEAAEFPEKTSWHEKRINIFILQNRVKCKIAEMLHCSLRLPLDILLTKIGNTGRLRGTFF